MPYTRPWPQVNNLLGSRDADEIDEGSRETHLDLTERFGDILQDVNADPWVLKKSGIFGQPNVRYPWHSGYVQLTGGTIIIGPNHVTVNGLTAMMKVWMPVPVPVGFKLKKVDFRWKRDQTGTATGEVFKTRADGVTIDLVGTVAIPPATLDNVMVISAVNADHACLDAETFFAIVTTTNPTNAAFRGYFADMGVVTEPVSP